MSDNQKEVGNWGNLIKIKLQTIKKYAGNKILDVGCSSGKYVYYLNKNGFNAYGCDIEKNPLWSDNPSKFEIGNIYKLPYKDKSFDTILAFEILEHLDNPELALIEISRVTRKNVIISVPNCELAPAFNESGLSFYHNIDKTHVNRFTVDEISKVLIDKGYKIDLIKKISPVKPGVLFFYSLSFPLPLANFLGKLFNKISIKKIYSDILVVASK